MRPMLLIAAAVATVSAGVAHAREPLRLKPVTRWVLDYADDNCRLARQFGEGDRTVTAVFEMFEPGEFFKMRLIGKPVQARGSDWSNKVGLRFGPTEEQSRVSAIGATGNEVPILLFQGGIRVAPLTKAEEAEREQAVQRGVQFVPEPLGPPREAAATWMELKGGVRSDLVLETGPMDKPLAALRKCAWETVAHWGLDVEQQKGLSRRLAGRLSSRPWLRSGDYPEAMIRGGHQGIVHFRLLVDAAGKPTACHIQQSTRPKEFDEAVCRAVMKRALFEPALDANGKPVPSYWVQTVNFRME
ncbi:MAG TPA: energy transducer TonB [Sphingomicrobium sp.]|nr:energy transducer TonB [Sphingomicrobium sp.]